MHALISAAASHAGHSGIPFPLKAVMAAAIIATVIMIVLKVLVRLLSPRRPRPGTRPPSPYGPARR